MPAASRQASPSAAREPVEIVAAHLVAAQRLDRVAEVHQQLAVLPAHDVGPDDRLEGRGAEGGCDRFRGLVGSVRIAPDVEQPVERGGRDRDDARLDVSRGAHDADRVDALEATKRRPFVGDAVLDADDRDAVAPDRRERFERRERVLRLHRQQDDVVRAELELTRVCDRRDAERLRACDVVDAEPLLADRLEMRPARDEHDVVPGLMEPSADDAADGAGPVDDEAHAATLEGGGDRPDAEPGPPSCPSGSEARRCGARERENGRSWIRTTDLRLIRAAL